MKTDILEKLRVAFREEAKDLLAELDEALLALEAQPDDHDLIGRVFRAIHTIKGSGSTAGFKDIASFTHKVEEVFNEAREGRLRITPQITDLTLHACDLVGKLLESDQPQAYALEVEQLVSQLAEFSPDSLNSPTAQAQAAKAIPAQGRFNIFFHPTPEIFYSGNDPVNILSELAAMGECRLQTQAAEVPLLDSLEPEKCYLAWEIELITNRSETQIREVFAFVDEGSEVRVSASEYNESLSLRNRATFPADSLREFFEESQEQLASVEDSLLALESNRSSRDLVNAMFRGLHNLKGNAGVLISEKEQPISRQHPLLYIQRIGHATESLVDELRSTDNFCLRDQQVELLFASFDLLKRQVVAFRRERIDPVTDDLLLHKLGLERGAFAEQAEPCEQSDQDDKWVLFFQTAAQCQEAMKSALNLAQTEPTASRAADKAYLRAAKTFLSATRFVNISDLANVLEKQIALLDPIIAAKDAVPAQAWSDLDADLSLISKALQNIERGKPDVQETNSSEKEKQSPNGASPATNGNAHNSIRVDQEKLEKLMRVAGELLVARSILPVLAKKIAALENQSGLSKEVRDAGAQISRIANDLQSTVMAIRMLPLRTVFQKFPRMVRDLARSLGKEINFTTQGEETELDKTVIEQIGDPLIHLVRNALDHGIETTGERKAQGKAERGEVKIVASNEGTQVVIQIIDDGRGLNAEVLKRKAVEKNRISEAEAKNMSDAQAYQLIFAAGFSTAEQVTDVSGRGVGMDVVLTNLNHLHGTIAIETRLHHGTTFTIKLPTSLMVSKGVLLQTNGQEFILPMGQTRDLVKVHRRQIRTFKCQRMAQIRGKIYPLTFLEDILNGPDSPADRSENQESEHCVAIIQNSDQHYGLIVDRFISEVEIIIKPLSNTLEGLKTYLGAAIMGDGRLVLVLNPAELAQNISSVAA